MSFRLTTMTSNQKSQFYLEMIERSHEAFREFLTHLPEDILTWKVHDSLYSAGWIIEHLIHDQMWIVNVILNNKEEGYHLKAKPEGLNLDDLIEGYDDLVSEAEEKLSKITDVQLNEARSYKEYSISVEDWLFEYIQHLNHHGGELSLILTAWKRKNRSLTEE